jgi:RNA polymerase sigma-70 factor, ECF subfamily
VWKSNLLDVSLKYYPFLVVIMAECKNFEFVPMSQTDEEIVQKVQTGDVESFGLLVERYEAKMKRYAWRLLLGGPDHEDVVQDVFIKAYTNIKSFDIKRRFSPWLYRIAHNELVNTIKKKSKEPVPFFDPDTLFPHPVAREETDQSINQQELKTELEKCLHQLGPKYREPLVLYFFEEMDYNEISDVLRIPVSTVGVRLKRGKEAMKKILEKNDSSPSLSHPELVSGSKLDSEINSE